MIVNTITNKDVKWSEVGSKFAKESRCSLYQMAAVLIKGGRLMSFGVNAPGGPAFYIKKHRPNLSKHAEIECLKNLNRDDTANTTLYVVGKTVNGTTIFSRPCQSCMEFCKRMGIKRVVYHDRDGNLIKERV